MGARRGVMSVRGAAAPPVDRYVDRPPVEPPPSSGLAPRAPLSGGSCRDREGRGGAGWRRTHHPDYAAKPTRPPCRPG